MHLVEFVNEVVDDSVVEFVAHNRIFDLVVDARVVVDFNYNGASVDDLQIDAVQTFADKCSGFGCGFENFVRHFVDR